MPKTNKYRLSIAAFLIPFGMLLACFAVVGIAPFGDKTILLYDSSLQYLDFASYLQTVFAGENDLFYTFSKNMGGEMLSLLSYYLLSPFSLLFVFGSKATLPLVFTLVVMLKISMCGLTFFYGASRQYGYKWTHLIFSTAYALMGYNVLYGWNIMWMDGVLILPLLALGLRELWRGRSGKLYLFSLAYGLLTNFYIGYMLCIGSVLFSIAHVISTEGPLGCKCRRFGKFVFASCVGGFSAAFVWLPTFFALLGGRASNAGTALVWTRSFNILGLAGKVVAGSATAQHITLGTPHIFCGLFAVLLAAVFFLHRGNAIPSRLAALGVLGVLLVSFSIRGLDIIWHGFSPNNAFNYRYAFLFSYVILMLALHTWENRREIPKALFALTAALLLVMLAGVLVLRRRMGLDFISVAGVAVSGVVLVAVAAYLLKGDALRRAGTIAVCLACLLELAGNCCLSMGRVTADATMLHLAAYQDTLRRVEPVVEAVKAMDTGFYRMEKTFQRNKNDAMLYAYNGLSHFSSSQAKSVTRFMKKLGMTSYEDVWSQYGAGVTAGVDALLGVKYVLSEQDLSASRGYALRDTVNGIGIYENENVLPIALLCDGEAGQTMPENGDVFALQNTLWSGIAGGEIQTMLPAEATVTCENLSPAENADGTVTYTKEDPSSPAVLTWEISVTREDPLYFYFSAPHVQSAQLYVNGEDWGSYFSDYRWDAVHAGSFSQGDTVTVSLVPNRENLTVGGAYFYYEDLSAVTKTAQSIKASPVTLEKEASSRLRGSFTAREGQLLLFTVPYEAGWKLTVDGKQVACRPAMGVFLAAEVPEGQHTYQLRFIPQGLIPGCAITAAALLTTAAWLLLKKKHTAR